jgi:soluble lytic murein transglycosylase-like protein
MRGTGNKYAYADNNPLSSVDVYGLYTIDLNGMEESSEFPGELAAFVAAESHEQITLQTDSRFTDTSDENSAGSATDPQPATNQQQAQARQSQQQGQPAQHQQAPQQLSAKSQAAIENAFGKGSADALLWSYSFIHAGAENGVDPNLLVGLADKESSLNPNAKNGTAVGMFQVTPGRAADLGLSGNGPSNPNVVTNAVAASLASATKAFHGNVGLAIASWTVGVAGTRAEFNAQGMQGVRNLFLDKAHPSYGRVGPNYIDFVTGFQTQ